MKVSFGDRVAGAFWHAIPFAGPLLANLETAVLGDAVANVDVRQPIFVAGLARSGTTVLLEALNAHPLVTAHHYADYRLIWTPYWWNLLRSRTMPPVAQARERAHGDRVMVTFESPEAFEEVLWMHYFPGLHSGLRVDLLTAGDENPVFTQLLREHIAKLLLVRGRQRYLAKCNYHIGRLALLLQMFPDARFVIPVREPCAHVESLVRQDARFSGAGQSRAVRRHLQRVGHYEFGLDKQPVRLGDSAIDEDTLRDWREGRVAQGYARQWASVYGTLLRQLGDMPTLRAQVRIVRYEDLCTSPQQEMRAIFAHCSLDDEAGTRIADERSASVSPPDYYASQLLPADRSAIRNITAAVATRLGY